MRSIWKSTKIVQSVGTDVLFVLDSKKTQVENVFPIEISVFSAAAVIGYRQTHETNCWLCLGFCESILSEYPSLEF